MRIVGVGSEGEQKGKAGGMYFSMEVKQRRRARRGQMVMQAHSSLGLALAPGHHPGLVPESPVPTANSNHCTLRMMGFMLGQLPSIGQPNHQIEPL